MNSHVRCSNCKSYFRPEDQFPGRTCSDECFVEKRSRPAARRTPIRSNGRQKQNGSRGSTRSVIPAPIRKQVMARDCNKCVFCGTRDALHVHHIVYRSQGGEDEPSNLIVLCAEHHDKVHSDKRRWFPVCRAYIWLYYVDGKRTKLYVLERILDKAGLLKRRERTLVHSE